MNRPRLIDCVKKGYVDEVKREWGQRNNVSFPMRPDLYLMDLKPSYIRSYDAAKILDVPGVPCTVSKVIMELGSLCGTLIRLSGYSQKPNEKHE